ncbi:MAG: zf-HC2 domain-containing protein [Candidatus Omnitrophica bacterium]|nr:zf-HC2 domain-containing protein [Candidatus Omnitrophota bacterium]
MRCNAMRELILTNYVDGCMSEKEERRFRRHVEACSACREFAVSACQVAGEPFAGMPHEKTPAGLWASVQKALREDSAPRKWSRWAAAIERSVFWLRCRAAAPALASIFLMLAYFAVQRYVFPVASIQSADAVEYLADILGYAENGEYATEGYGTELENVFLAS